MATKDLAARPRAAERPFASAVRGAKFLIKRAFAAVDPWYDWGKIDFWRLDGVERDFSDESITEGRYFVLQWFGLHLQITVGVMPPKCTDEEVRQRKARHAKWAAEREQEA